MAELGLSTAGSRQMLEKRHQEWVTIWNANCDSVKPKKRSELLQDLEVWEKTMGSRAPTMSRAANMGAQIKDKDFDGAAWASRHDTSFKDLIARARSSRSNVAQKADGGSRSEEGSKARGSAQDDGSGVDGATSRPGLSSPVVVDLTGPPSSQLEPDSPSKFGRDLPTGRDFGSLGGSQVLGKEVLHPQADSIPTYSPEQEGAPS